MTSPTSDSACRSDNTSDDTPDDNKRHTRQTYARLLGYLRHHRLALTLSIIGFALFALCSVAFAQLMEELIEALDAPSRVDSYWIPLALVATFMVRGLGTFLGEYFMAIVAQGVVHRIRVELFDGLTRLPVDYIDRNNSGELISRITFNVTQVTSAISDAWKVLIREGLTVIGLLGFMFYKDWQLTAVYLLVGPVVAFIVVVASKRFRRISRKIQGSMGQITHICGEMIRGFHIMRGFNGEDYERGRFKDSSQNLYKQHVKMAKTMAISTPIVQVVVAVALAILMFLALKFSGADSAAEFMAYFTAASLIPKSLRQLTKVSSMIEKGVAAAETIFTQFDEKPETQAGEPLTKRAQGQLEFRDIAFHYQTDDSPVLQQIELAIQSGESVAIVGHSGSGKSTLVSLLPRFYEPSAGCILLDGTDIQAVTLTSLREQIALVDQNVVLLNDTVANNIAYGHVEKYSREQVEQAACLAHAYDFIQALPQGFDTLLGENGADLSGGQRQRLAIARAILKDAPILILDEATSALDTESERAIQLALTEVMKGKTTLVIAHRLSTVEKVDKIVVMDAGRIVEQGTHTELLERQGYYARLHGMQQDSSLDAEAPE